MRRSLVDQFLLNAAKVIDVHQGLLHVENGAARRAYFDDIANQSYEAIVFGLLVALVGLWLGWVGIFGPPG